MILHVIVDVGKISLITISGSSGCLGKMIDGVAWPRCSNHIMFACIRGYDTTKTTELVSVALGLYSDSIKWVEEEVGE